MGQVGDVSIPHGGLGTGHVKIISHQKTLVSIPPSGLGTVITNTKEPIKAVWEAKSPSHAVGLERKKTTAPYSQYWQTVSPSHAVGLEQGGREVVYDGDLTVFIPHSGLGTLHKDPMDKESYTAITIPPSGLRTGLRSSLRRL